MSSPPPPSHAAFRDRRIFGSLDGLRCASIVAVVWHHTTAGLPGLPASHHGFLGVDMFFVLSGFLIVTLLLREREATGHVSLRRFWARRSLRIFPIYYGLLAALAAALWLRPHARTAAPFFSELPFYLTYTSNWIPTHTMMGIAWSLAAEEQFYVFWPPVERFLRRATLPILGLVVAVNQLVNFRVADDALAQALGLHYGELSILQATFTPICLGVALAHLLHAPSGFRRVAGWLGSPWSPVVMAALLFALCNVPGDLGGWPRLSIQLMMAALLASCVVREDHHLRPLLTALPVRRVGVVSYGMYLYHLFALHGAEWLLARAPLRLPYDRFALCLLLTVAVAELSYRWVETPFLRLKGRLGGQRRPPPDGGMPEPQPRTG